MSQTALDKAIARHGLDRPFPLEVETQVARLVDKPGIDDPSLVDRRALPFVTIDNVDSRDLDQALYVTDTDGGGWQVYYALADGAHFVPAGSALFDDALSRGASYYLPGRVFPMLPRALSEGLVSLNPNVERRALLMCMHVDRDGEVVETALERARIKSRAKLSYEGVQHFLDGDPGALGVDEPAIHDSLRAMAGVGRARLARADERDIVRYRRNEVEVKLVSGTAHFSVLSRPRLTVERYNEQISLMCNVSGAKTLLAGRDSAHVHPIFRIHPDPEPQRFADFSELLDGLCGTQGLDVSQWGWKKGRSRSLADFLAALPSEGEGARIALAVHRQALLMNYRSSFSTEPGGHYGVGASIYGRFSAPMREIVGIFTHKELWEHLGTAVPLSDDEDRRERVVEAANTARRVQGELSREANLAVLDQLLADDLQSNRERTGTLVGLTRNKLHVQLDDPAIDVKVYLAHLGEQVAVNAAQTAVDDGARRLCALGDGVRVRVLGDEHDRGRRRWRFALERLA